MEFTELSKEQRQAMCKQRLIQFETEYFNHEMNLVGFQSLPDDDPNKEPNVKNAQQSMTTLENAIAAVKDMLSQLDDNTPFTAE